MSGEAFCKRSRWKAFGDERICQLLRRHRLAYQDARVPCRSGNHCFGETMPGEKPGIARVRERTDISLQSHKGGGLQGSHLIRRAKCGSLLMFDLQTDREISRNPHRGTI